MHGRGQGGHAQDALAIVERAKQPIHPLLIAIEEPLDLWQKLGALRGEAHMVRAALQHRGAQHGLQLADGGRQRGLRERQRLGRLPKAHGPGHGLKAAQLAQRGRTVRGGGLSSEWLCRGLAHKLLLLRPSN